MKCRSACRLVLLLLITVSAGGCGGPRLLMPTPNLYVDAAKDPFASVPEPLRKSTVDLLYVTDRAPETSTDGRISYTAGRSPSMAFGSCAVEIGEGLDWAALCEESTRAKRSRKLPLRIAGLTELGRFPPTPLALLRDADGVRIDPAALAAHAGAGEALVSELSRRLALSPRREALIFVHGYNNSFEAATFRLAELSHFLAHDLVPILYSWPAGRGGLTGYTTDRESGEFTIFHLKQFLRAIAACPGLERVHILAHSRGTDVATSALRELFIESRGGGGDFISEFRSRYKLGHVVLAAADLDLEVAMQRLTAEQVGLGAERLTVYVSEDDKAIGLAGWLFTSLRRIGELRFTDYEAYREKVPNLGGLAVIESESRTDFLGHGYFLKDSAASSDLILLLRDQRSPGAAHGRPLIDQGGGYWLIPSDYLLKSQRSADSRRPTTDG
jgi:esterase/lipase superfamily enzyme